jgi:hypothetical protein
MSTLEGVGIGDLHLDKVERLLPGIGNKWVQREMRKPLDYALENGIEHVFYYGDIFEYPRATYESMRLFKHVIFAKKYRNLNQWIILGNHDYDEKGRHSLEFLLDDIRILQSYGIEPRIKVFINQEDYEIEGVPVRFLPHPYTKTSKSRLNIGHFEVAGAIRDNGRKIKEGVESSNLVLLGHLHTPHRVGNNYFSGTLYQTNFGEALPKSFHHFKVRDDLKHKVTNIRNEPEYVLENKEIYTVKDLKKLSDNPKHLYKLFVQDAVDVDPAFLNEHTNVKKVNRFKTEEELKVQLDEEWKLGEDVGQVFQPKEDLVTFLNSKGISKEVQKRTLSRHDEALRKIGVNV